MALKKVRNTNTNVSSNIGGAIQGGTNRPQINKTSLSNSLSRSKYKYTTYNENFPGLNEASYNKLEETVDKMGLSGAEKQTAMNEWYRDNVKYLLNDQILEERGNQLNEQAFKAAELNNPQANAQLRMTEFSQALKKKYNLDATADDLDVFETFVKNLGPNGIELAGQYLSGENKKLWYDAGLETFGEKVADFGVGVLQSPGKWGYNMVGQWMDRLGHWGAEKILGHEIATDENTFNGREATDIRTPILGEERANSKATRVGETVGDIATGIAVTAPIGAALAPAIAGSSAVGAAGIGAVEGGIDTLLTQYGSQGNLDVTPMQMVLGVGGGALGGWLSNRLANLPKNQSQTIRKEAEGYIDKAIRPTVKGKQNQVAYDKFMDDTLDVTDWMSKNKGLIQYTDDTGEVVTGKLPTNLNQTREALDNMKKHVYDTYNKIAQEAGDAGARVDLNKVFSQLDDLADDAASNIANPGLKNVIDSYKNQLLEYSDDLGRISIEDAQKLTQNYNKILEAYFKNPGAYANDTSRNIVIAQMNRGVKNAIDDSIDDVLNTSIKNGSKASETYKYWKQLYGKIKTIEDEVSKSALREMRKNTKGISSQVIDALAGEKLVEGLLTQSPTSLFKSIAMKSIDAYNKYLNNPNTQINNLFKLVDKANNPSAFSSAMTNITADLGSNIGSETLAKLGNLTTNAGVVAGNVMGNSDLE